MSSESFLSKVTSYIRSKEAKIYVHEELKQHIEHSKNAWIKKGYTKEEAEQKTIEEMGSPAELGKSMDKIHKPKWDWVLISFVVILLVASFIPIVTFDSTEFLGLDLTDYYIRNKVVHLFCAVLLMVILMYFNYQKLMHYSKHLYGIALFLLIFINYFGTGMIAGESFIEIGPIRIKAWTILPLFLIAWASFFTQKKYASWQLILLFLLPLWYILRTPNLAAASIYVGIVVVLFLMSYYSVKAKVLTLLTSFTLFVGSFAIMMPQLKEYQLVRIYAFLNPETYATAEGYVYLVIKNALNEAGWFGAETIQYIPEGHTDFALVQLIQAYGYIAGIAIVAILFAIAIRILWKVYSLPHSFGKILVVGAVALYCMQFMYSIGMVLGWLPITGMSLPFISYGFTPLIINAFVMGIILSVFRRKSIVQNSYKQKIT